MLLPSVETKGGLFAGSGLEWPSLLIQSSGVYVL